MKLTHKLSGVTVNVDDETGDQLLAGGFYGHVDDVPAKAKPAKSAAAQRRADEKVKAQKAVDAQAAAVAAGDQNHGE